MSSQAKQSGAQALIEVSWPSRIPEQRSKSTMRFFTAKPEAPSDESAAQPIIVPPLGENLPRRLFENGLSPHLKLASQRISPSRAVSFAFPLA